MVEDSCHDQPGLLRDAEHPARIVNRTTYPDLHGGMEQELDRSGLAGTCSTNIEYVR